MADPRNEVRATGKRLLLVPPLPPRPPVWQRVLYALVPYGMLLVVGSVVAFVLWIALRPSPGDGALTWHNPAALLLLPQVVPVLAFLFFHFDRRRSAAMRFSRTDSARAAGHPLVAGVVKLPRVLRLAAVVVVIIALARPQRPSAELSETEGIDIVVALDVSNSMSERDLAPDRLTAAKAVLSKFITPRKNDRIGLVIFGREAFTQCPLTLDHKSLLGLLADVRLDLIDGRGTAIGNALATALNRLRHADKKQPGEEPKRRGSQVIILLTDGDNNSGNIAPMEAARIAQTLGVKIFTVLMGRDAAPEPPGRDRFGLLVRPPPRYPVNPKLLEDIASATGGSPYLATDTQALERRFQAILDELDKSRITDHKARPRELYPPFAVAALALLLVELALSLTRFRRFP